MRLFALRMQDRSLLELLHSGYSVERPRDKFDQVIRSYQFNMKFERKIPSEEQWAASLVTIPRDNCTYTFGSLIVCKAGEPTTVFHAEVF